MDLLGSHREKAHKPTENRKVPVYKIQVIFFKSLSLQTLSSHSGIAVGYTATSAQMERH